jgi:hypothetical protein
VTRPPLHIRLLTCFSLYPRSQNIAPNLSIAARHRFSALGMAVDIRSPGPAARDAPP